VRRTPWRPRAALGWVTLALVLGLWGPLVGCDRRAPDLALESADGAVAVPAATPRIYHLWATWCLPCLDELPVLQRNIGRLEAAGVRIYAAANETHWGPLRAHFGEAGVPPWVYRQRSTDWAAAQKATTLPVTFFVDAAGAVTHRFEGALDWDALDPANPQSATSVRKVPPPFLLGHRYLAGPADDVDLWVPVFDRESRPVLRLPAGRPGAPAEPLRVRITDAAGATFDVTSAPRTSDGHTFHVLPWPNPPPATGAATLRVLPEGLNLSVELALPPESLPPVDEIVALRKAGRFEDARTRATELRAAAGPALRHWLDVERARAQQAAGIDAAVVQAWVAAAESATSAGLGSEAARCLRAAALMAERLGDYPRMRALVDAAAAQEGGERDPRAVGRTAYVRAGLALRLGDVRTALDRFAEARVRAEATDQPAERALALAGLAAAEQAVGRHDAAIAHFETIFAAGAGAGPDPLWTAHTRANEAWAHLRRAEARGETRAFEPVAARFRAIGETAARLGARDLAAECRVNEAWALVLADRPDTALARLTPAGSGPPGADAPEPPAFAVFARAEAARRLGRLDEALVDFETVGRRLAETAGGPTDLAWRAALGEAEVHRAAGRTGRALDALSRAHGALEAVSRGAGLQADRAGFFRDRRVLSRTYVDALLEAGRTAEALAVADAAQSRVLRALETRLRLSALTGTALDAWAARIGAWEAARSAHEAAVGEARAGRRSPAEVAAARRAQQRAFDDVHAFLESLGWAGGGAMAPPHAALAPDEALLLGFPGETRDAPWRLFHAAGGAAGGAVAVTPLPADASELPARVRAVLTGRRHLYVVDGGHPGLRRLAPDAFAAPMTLSHLPAAGLVARTRPDAPNAPAAAPSAPIPAGPALVVADPAGDLPGAREEGRFVATQLPGARLLLGAEASRAAVRAALEGAPVWHFAGHGVLTDDDPFAAHLRLAAGERLTVADVLIERPGVPLVVLDGCETGGDSTLENGERIGLPAAFLAAGTRAVIAADRVVTDAEALAFARRFYAAGGTTTPAAAFRRAVADGRAAGETFTDAYRLHGRP
jgi:tetratricopeptide (TPR) repeat protein